MMSQSAAYRPLSHDPRMAASRSRTGSDIRQFAVYCSNASCRTAMGRDGPQVMPVMNYHGTKFALLSHHRIHVFVCSICNREKRYRRKWFGKEWQRIR